MFTITVGEVYCSPIVDCFEGMLHYCNIRTIPDASLVNTMLEQAISALHKDKHPIVHSDMAAIIVGYTGLREWIKHA